MDKKESQKLMSDCLRKQLEFFGNAKKTILSSDKRLLRLFTDIPLSFFNLVAFSYLNRKELLENIKDIKKYAKGRNTGLHWIVGPDDRPEGIKNILTRSGFKHQGNITGMSLSPIPEVDIGTDAKGLQISRVDDTKSLTEWLKVCMSDHPGHEKYFKKIIRFENSLGLGPGSKWLRFIAKLDEKAVATSALFLADSATIVDNIATVKEHRKKGIANLMVRNLLGLSKDRGYDTVVLFSSDMGKDVYRSLGFKGDYQLSEYDIKD